MTQFADLSGDAQAKVIGRAWQAILIRRLEKTGGHVAIDDIKRAIEEAERMDVKVEVRDVRTFTEAE